VVCPFPVQHWSLIPGGLASTGEQNHPLLKVGLYLVSLWYAPPLHRLGMYLEAQAGAAPGELVVWAALPWLQFPLPCALCPCLLQCCVLLQWVSPQKMDYLTLRGVFIAVRALPALSCPGSEACLLAAASSRPRRGLPQSEHPSPLGAALTASVCPLRTSHVGLLYCLSLLWPHMRAQRKPHSLASPLHLLLWSRAEQKHKFRPTFDFHKVLVRTLEKDFNHVAGTR